MSTPEHPLPTCRPANRPIDLPPTPPSSIKQPSPVSPSLEARLVSDWRKQAEAWVRNGA
ncbi:hypothetical protein FRC06_001772, partial [Ceratobasidium sp. 370]